MNNKILKSLLIVISCIFIGFLTIMIAKKPPIKTPTLSQSQNLPLPPGFNLNVSLMRKDKIDGLNLVWIHVLKHDYQRGDETPVNQNEQHCVQENRPKGDKIWLPEVCYMVPIEIRNNKNQHIAGDILMLGKDDIISLEPKYREGTNIIAKIEISQSNGEYNSIPYAAINEKSYIILYNMLKEVSLTLQGKSI